MKFWEIGIISSLSILSYNVLNPSFFIIVIFMVCFIGGFLYFEEKRTVILYGIIFILFWFACSIFIFNGDVEKEKVYAAKGEFNGKNIVITSLDGKGSCKSMIFKDYSGNSFKGRGVFLIRADKMEKNKNRYIIKGEILELKKGVFDKIRDYLFERIKNISENKMIHGITAAVILGDNSELSDELQKGFRYTGTAHIIVISGMHIAVIIVAILKIAEILKMVYKSKYILTFIILTVYCFIVGMSPPVARSYIMGAIFLISKLLWEKAELEKSFWISYVGILFFNPEQLYSISFQLSFGAVFALIYLYELIKNENDNFFVELLKMSFIIQLVLSPFFIIYFGTFPILSIFANLAAIPIGTVMIQFMFGAVAITAVTSIFDKILKFILNYIVEILIFYVNLFEKIPFMQIEADSTEKVIFIFIYLILSAFIILKILKRKKEEEINKKKTENI